MSQLIAGALALALSVSLVLLTATGFTLLASVWPQAAQHLFAAAGVELVTYGIGSACLLTWLRPRTKLWSLRRLSFGVLVCSALAGVALHGPLDYIEHWVEHLLPLSDAVWSERAARLSPPSAGERALLMIAVAGVVPLVEEYFFRGALFELLGRSRGSAHVVPWAAANPGLAPLESRSALPRANSSFGEWAFPIGLSSVCFALSHGEPRNWPALLLVAGVMGLLRVASGSLYPSILLHAAFNATTLVVSYSTSVSSHTRATPGLGGALLGSCVSGLLLAFALSSRKSRGERRASGEQFETKDGVR
ncbi:MAG TPA: CPBP family intramembrane glutamic endopeptidase [Polyangiaceae bacterium]|nr:CPBP family intramembrane glutamic endopeptidase [Polyangiaceae bacterium]